MKITVRNIFTGLALAAGLILPAAGLAVTATPANAATYQYFGAESATSGASAFVQFNAAHSSTLISIQSGHVNCPAFNGAQVKWCGTVGNNTSHAQAGVNYTVNGVSHYMREDVYAPVWYGYVKCSTRGDVVSFVTYCNGAGN
jgi:hypothetical protein